MVGLTPEEKLRLKTDQTQALRELLTNPAFQHLKNVVEKKRDLVVHNLAASILAGAELDPLKIAKVQSFYEGAMHVLNRPDNAEKAFTEALKRLEMEKNE